MTVYPTNLTVYSAETINIETLPPEIKVLLLLNLPDPTSLRALLFLSVALFNCLSYTGLHIALTVLEASVTLQKTDNYDDDEAEENEENEDLIFRKKRIRYRFFEQPSSIHISRHWLDSLDFDTLTSLLHYHWKVAAVATSYIEETLSTNPVTGEPQSFPDHQYLTKSESARIYRALYHFELYCLLFSSHDLGSSPGQETLVYGQLVALNYVENQFSLLHFLPLLKSWEIEEIACIRTYIHHKYTSILQSCASELKQLEVELGTGSHRFFKIPHNSREDPHDISTPTILEERKEYLLSLGLKFLSPLISPSTTPTTHTHLIHANPHRRQKFLSRAIAAYRSLESHTQSANRYNTEILTFISDANWEEGSHAALPWSRFWDLESFYRGREFLRGWGYVFWDWERLERWGVLNRDVGDWLGGWMRLRRYF